MSAISHEQVRAQLLANLQTIEQSAALIIDDLVLLRDRIAHGAGGLALHQENVLCEQILEFDLARWLVRKGLLEKIMTAYDGSR